MAKSVCTAILCGNGHLDAGEECDDGNFIDGDGCDSSATGGCLLDVGWHCVGVVCSKDCGDGVIEIQKRLSTGVVIYSEQCDGITGCTATCTPVLGYTCTVNPTTLA